ncbi:MAG: 6,7-dimethyl-8-ribityllumazine synthase [Candidatus Diapherotrites archaeon]|nr:6,7-dimethyl-8-ribityllumazine synthase [Candidatus Diapherotrites archaeon]
MGIGIIVAEFNKEMTQRMLDAALKIAEREGLAVDRVVWVPGVYDMPLSIKRLLKSDVDAVVLLGVVKKGLTAHDVIVAENAARVAADLAVEFEKPVTLGVIGPSASLDVARERLEEYAERAVVAAKKMLENA